MIKENFKQVNSYLTPTGIPSYDIAVNPYIGCTHKCIYCYAEFMKRFTNHPEAWGDFVDIKLCDKNINISKLKGKRVIMSSVTDPYNPYEKEYEITRSILEKLKDAEIEMTVITKSDLILRDIDILKEFNNIITAFSLNTVDDGFRKKTEPYASSVEQRLEALQKLHNSGISTVLFMSPMFPGITDYREIMDETKDYVDSYWLENLNLRGSFKYRVLNFLASEYPDLRELYNEIYRHKDITYWLMLEEEIDNYCKDNHIDYKNYFHHGKVTNIKMQQGTCKRFNSSS